MQSSWVSCPQRRPDAVVRLICIPHAGGGAASFHPLAALLPPTIEVLSIQLPGRETRLAERPHTRMRPLIEELADAVMGITTRQYAFFGHSMGALISFELSRELRRRGCNLPRLLVASGRRAPTVPHTEPPLHPLPDDAFVGELVRRYDAIPQVILQEPELMALFIPVLKADFAVFETHQHAGEPPLACAAALYGGRDDPQTEQMDGWTDLFTGPVRRRLFDGGHFYLGNQRQALASALAEDVLTPVPAE